VVLVVVRDFDFVGISILPAETDPILLIDPDAVLSVSIARESLEMVPGRNRELLQIPDTVELRQLAPKRWPELPRARSPGAPAVHTVEQIFGRGIGEGPYHTTYYNA